jgi:cell wall-associated NlpC family hydrolase
MPTTTRPVVRPGENGDGSSTAHRPSLRALVLTALVLGLVMPATAVLAAPSPAEIQQRITRESTALAKIVEDYNRVTEELKVTTAAATRHKTRLPELERQLAAAESDVREIAATAYKTGQLREMDAVLSTGGTSALLDRIGTLDHLARGRRAQIAGFTAARQRYDTERRRLDNALAKQKIQMRDLAVRKSRIEADLKKLYQLRREAFGSEQETGSRYSGSIPSISGKAGVAVRFAYNAIGAPYVWAGSGPGYDCSGLTQAAWKAAGRSLPHNAAMQWDKVAHIGRSQLMPGDLVFYSGLGHVGLYVGNGKIIHAPSFGQSVKLVSVNIMTPYGYGRVR